MVDQLMRWLGHISRIPIHQLPRRTMISGVRVGCKEAADPYFLFKSSMVSRSCYYLYYSTIFFDIINSLC